MRVWVRTDRLTGLGLTTADIIKALQSQNVQAAVGRIGARPTSNDQQLQLNIQTKGPADLGQGFRADHHPDQSRRIDAATGRRRAAGTRGGEHGPLDAPERRAGDADRRLSGARRQRAAALGGVKAMMAGRGAQLSGRSRVEGDLRSDHVRHRDDP